MNRTTTLFAAVILALVAGMSSQAQAAPNEIHAQGILRDGNGDLMSGKLDVVFRIYDSQANGQVLWQEAVSVVLIGGVFDVLLPAAPDKFPFPADLFDKDDRWLSITPTGQQELSRTRLSSVPYAFQANRAADLQCSGCIGSDEVGFNYASSSAPGGAATTALTANEALVANNVACVGCITLQAIDAAVLSADNVSYDNTGSGLASTNVQDAIDENALTLAQHLADNTAHGGAGSEGAKVRVINGNVNVVTGQVATEYVHVFSADAPKVYLYAYGREAAEGNNVVLSSGAGTVFYTRCAWVGDHAKSISTCTPPSCPKGWADLGFTSNLKVDAASSGSSITNSSYSTSAGYQERACFQKVVSQIPQGVQIWIDGADRTVAISDQQAVGLPAWTGTSWGADGTTPWATGRLDISQVIPWGVGEHTLQFKTTGASGGKILYYVYLVHPAAKSVPFANDGCGGAEALVFKGGVAKVDATTEDMLGENKALDDLSPQGCGGAGGGDVVYSAKLTERTTIKASLKAPFVPRLYVLDSPCGNQKVLACGKNVATTAELDPGTYYVVVDSDSAGQKGDFSLTVEAIPSPLPGNDTCDTAKAINAGPNPSQVTGTTKWGLDQYKGTCGGDKVADVVYSFAATDVNDDLSVTLTAPFASVLILRGQGCAGGFQLACSTNGKLAIPGLAPGTYYIFVDGVTVADEGDFTLNVLLN
ncbi:MAG: hypothetical protein FJ109_05015 [Deltaproteobacteria bacterium]|nr:hypothetical protein [Deltaproteobacteria bacterium]